MNKKDLHYDSEYTELRMARDFELVKILGDQIGYGNMMELAAVLWRDKLRAEGLPESGAFAVVGNYDLTPDQTKSVCDTHRVYDSWLKKIKKNK